MLAPCMGRNRSKRLMLLTAWGAMLPLPLTLLGAPQEPGELTFGPSEVTFELEAGGDEGRRTAMGTPTECGDPLATDCYVGINDIPFCNDFCNAEACEGCCDTVCGQDPFCCNDTWDVLCANAAIAQCEIFRMRVH